MNREQVLQEVRVCIDSMRTVTLVKGLGWLGLSLAMAVGFGMMPPQRSSGYTPSRSTVLAFTTAPKFGSARVTGQPARSRPPRTATPSLEGVRAICPRATFGYSD